MATTTPPNTQQSDSSPPPQVDPKLAVQITLAEVEIIRAQLGITDAPPAQPVLRDVSPFGR
jgi:hypothetical protein